LTAPASFRKDRAADTHTALAKKIFLHFDGCDAVNRQPIINMFSLLNNAKNLLRSRVTHPITTCIWQEESQVSFGFLPAKSQILIRTASFSQRFAVSENNLCLLFANDERRQLQSVFMQFVDNVRTARQLRSAVLVKFFDGSELLLVDYVCCFMRCRVTYFQCLGYLAPPLCVVGLYLTSCVYIYRRTTLASQKSESVRHYIKFIKIFVKLYKSNKSCSYV